MNVGLNYWFSTLLLDWEVTLSIDVIDFSKVQGFQCLQDQQLYDQCITSQFLAYLNNSSFSSFFHPSNDKPDMSGVPMEIIQDYFAIINSKAVVSRCASSCSQFHVQFEQKAKRY
jgi:hypothetical protein